MKNFISSYAFKIDIDKLFKFHLDPKNLRLLSKPGMNLKILNYELPLRKNSIVNLNFNLLPLVRVNWELKIEEIVTNELLVDLQVKGPFRFWRHKHIFNRLFDGTVILTDEIEYDAGFIGNLLDPIIKWRLRKMFTFRYKILETILGG